VPGTSSTALRGSSTCSWARATAPRSSSPSAHAAGGAACGIRSKPAALRHRAGVERETAVPKEAYAHLPRMRHGPYQDGDLPDFTLS